MSWGLLRLGARLFAALGNCRHSEEALAISRKRERSGEAARASFVRPTPAARPSQRSLATSVDADSDGLPLRKVHVAPVGRSAEV